jgi:ribosomal protein L29
MMRFKDLTGMGAEERENKQRELELELIKLNTQVATGTPPKNAGMVRRIKKDIARIMLLKGNQAENQAKTQAKPKAKVSNSIMGKSQNVDKKRETKQ